MNEDKGQFREADLEAPARLREALRQLHQRSSTVPGEVDRALLDEARLQLQRVRNGAGAPGHTGRLPWGSVGSLAELLEGLAGWLTSRGRMAWSAGVIACMAIVIGVWLTVQPRPGALAADLNGDGAVDMLDAFSLARQLQRGQTLGTDLNGDGLVDEGDVQALAARAVRLNQGESS